MVRLFSRPSGEAWNFALTNFTAAIEAAFVYSWALPGDDGRLATGAGVIDPRGDAAYRLRT